MRILRTTDIVNLNVSYSDGGALTAGQLNASNTQLLFGVQEAIDIAKEAMAIDQTDGKFNAQKDGVDRTIKNVASPVSNTDAATKSYADGIATSAVVQAAAAASAQVTAATGSIIPDATKLAIHPVNTQYTLSDGVTTDYSAKHYQNLASVAGTTSATNATNAATSETNAQEWATKTTGIVDATGYSAKAWSIGGTDVSNTAGAGASQEWATKTTTNVDGTEFSAKEYAVGSQAANPLGSAKQWALGGGAGYNTSSATISTGGDGGSGTVILRLPRVANYNATQLANDTFVQNNGTATYSAASDGSGDHVITFTVATETAHPGDSSNSDGRMDWRPFWPDYSNVPVTSGLVVHLDAGVEASYSGSGSTWSDMSGNGNNFTLTNSPTFSSDNAGKLQFNGSNQYASGGPNLSTSDCSFVVIQRYASNNNSARGRILNGLNNNAIYGMHGGNTNAYYAEGNIATTPTGGDTDWHIHGFRENYSGDSRVIYDNNVAPSGQTASGGSQGPNQFMIGKFSTTANEYSDCEVAVLLVYNRTITTTELTTIFDFYKDRFGIS